MPLSWNAGKALNTNLLDFLVRLVLAAKRAELFHFQPFRGGLLVLRVRVVLPLAFGALERDNFARHIGSFTSEFPSQCRRPQSVRLRESRTASLCPWPLG